MTAISRINALFLVRVRARKLNSMEKSMLKKLENSVVGKANRFAPLCAGIVDGVSPAIAAIACLMPFFSLLSAFFN